MQGILRSAERVYAALALLVFSWAFIPLLQGVYGISWDPSAGDPVTQAILLPIYLVLVCLCLIHRTAILHTVARSHIYVLPVGIALLSVLWSVSPHLTLRRSIALVVTTAFGFYLGVRFTRSELLRLLGWTLGIAAVLSILCALLLPSFGITPGGPHTGAWRGIYPDKNSLGRISVLTAVSFALLLREETGRRWLLYAGVGLSVLLVLLSTSSTALIVLLAVAALLPLYLMLRWHWSWAVLALCLLILIAAGAVTGIIANADALASALGKDVTLTGRTFLWEAVVATAVQRPWLGYGFSAFWQGWSGESGQVLSMIAFWVPHAHNGFLDLWLELGLFGLIVFVLGLLVALHQAVGLARRSTGGEGIWPLVFLTFFMLYNMTESTILKQNSIFWILYIATVSSAFWRRGTHEETNDAAQEAPSEITSGLPSALRRPATLPALSPGVRRRYRHLLPAAGEKRSGGDA
jgi:O-antigen ligase